MLEGSILEEDNSDIFDQSMPIPPENAFDVPYVKFNYLYEITKGFHKDMEIGKGGFSEVYKAETARSKKMLAIKSNTFMVKLAFLQKKIRNLFCVLNENPK